MSATDSERDRVTAMILRMSIEQRLALVIRLHDYYHGPATTPKAVPAEMPVAVAPERR